MGLMKKDKDKGKNPNIRSYDDVSAGKTGCDVVEKVMDKVSEEPSGPDISEDANQNLKNLLNDMIGVMVSYHNKL